MEKLIRGRFQGVNDNIVKLALDLITNDVENLKARVAGVFPHIRMMVSARQPQQLQQQQQPQQPQNQQNQTSGNFKANDSFPQDIQARINALSDDDKQTLQNVAQSTVNDILSQSQGAINESDLEDSISQKYNISTDMASLVVDILKVVNNGAYAKQIIPDA